MNLIVTRESVGLVGSMDLSSLLHSSWMLCSALASFCVVSCLYLCVSPLLISHQPLLFRFTALFLSCAESMNKSVSGFQRQRLNSQK